MDATLVQQQGEVGQEQGAVGQEMVEVGNKMCPSGAYSRALGSLS